MINDWLGRLPPGPRRHCSQSGPHYVAPTVTDWLTRRLAALWSCLSAPLSRRWGAVRSRVSRPGGLCGTGRCRPRVGRRRLILPAQPADLLFQLVSLVLHDQRLQTALEVLSGETLWPGERGERPGQRRQMHFLNLNLVSLEAEMYASNWRKHTSNDSCPKCITRILVCWTLMSN